MNRKKNFKLSCLCFLLLVGLVAVSPGLCQSIDSADESSGRPNFGSPDSVPNRLESDRTEKGELFQLDFMKSYDAWKEQIAEDYGYRFAAAYVPVYFKASDSLPGKDDEASSAALRLFGFWELLGRGSKDTGTLIYLVEYRHRLGNTEPAGFAFDNLGYVGATGIPFVVDQWHLTNLYWDQKFGDGKYEVVTGYLDLTDFVDVWALTSPWTDFSNFVFSIGAATFDQPDDASLGLAASAMLTDKLYIIGGFEDLNSDPGDPLEGFDTFFSDNDYFKHFEIGLTTSEERVYLDNLHLTLWHADEREKIGIDDGWGGLLSFTHTLGDDWLVFLRGGYSHDGGSLLHKSVSTGGGYAPNGIGMPGSQLGFGMNWGQPNDKLFDTDKDQYALEVYYRLQVTKSLAITPDVQLLIDPALNPEKDTIWVFGLRARLAI